MLPNVWNKVRKNGGLALFKARQEDRKRAKEPPGKRQRIGIKDLQKAKAALEKANVPIGGFIPVDPGVLEFRLWRSHHDNDKAFDSGYGFKNALEKKGFVRLGGGNFSTVFGHPKSDRVIKVTTNLSDNWLDYVVWGTQSGYAGKHTPKVFSYKRIKGKNAEFAVTVMERMKNTLSRLDWKDDNKIVVGLFSYATHGNMMAKLLLEEVSPGLGSFSEALRKTFNKSLDLHGGNIMVRENGTICITDPVATISKLDHIRRLKTKDFTTVPLPNVVAANDNEEQENCHDYYGTVYS